MTGIQKHPVTYSIRIANPISHLTIKFYNIEITALKFFSISANFCLQDYITHMTAFVDVQVNSSSIPAMSVRQGNFSIFILYVCLNLNRKFYSKIKFE